MVRVHWVLSVAFLDLQEKNINSALIDIYRKKCYQSLQMLPISRECRKLRDIYLEWLQLLYLLELTVTIDAVISHSYSQKDLRN